MKCFYHAGIDAVGLCKSCGRALCHDCAVDLGKGIACRDRCEEDAQQLIALVDRNIRVGAQNIYGRLRRRQIGSALFYIVLGGGLLCLGLRDSYESFSAIIGGLFVLYGLFSLSQLIKAPDATMNSKPKA